jgi:hypothetical protein
MQEEHMNTYWSESKRAYIPVAEMVPQHLVNAFAKRTKEGLHTDELKAEILRRIGTTETVAPSGGTVITVGNVVITIENGGTE